MQGNAQLQGVQAVAIARGPASPDVRSLTDGAITAARDVTKDTIKQEGFLQHSREGIHDYEFPLHVIVRQPILTMYSAKSWLASKT